MYHDRVTLYQHLEKALNTGFTGTGRSGYENICAKGINGFSLLCVKFFCHGTPFKDQTSHPGKQVVLQCGIRHDNDRPDGKNRMYMPDHPD